MLEIRLTFQVFSVNLSAMEFLAKAKENLTAAQVCFDNGFYNACANRAYYSALQAAVALARIGINRDKIDHGQVQADFSNELINRRKIYPAKLKSYLPDIQFVRNKADYTDGHVGRKAVSLLLFKVSEMFWLIEKEVSDGKF